MKAWAFGILWICLPPLSFASQAVTIDYDELQDIIRKNNKGVLATFESVKAAKQRMGIVDHTFLPKAEFEAGLHGEKEANGRGETVPFWKVDVQANLFRGGRDKLITLQKESQVIIKEMDSQAYYRNELYKAKANYVHLSAVRQAQALTKGSMDDYEGLQKSITRKVKAGLMTATSIQNTQLEVDELKRQLILLEGEEHELEDRLGLVLGLTSDIPITLETKFSREYILSEAEFSETDIEALPEIQKLDIISRSSRLETQMRNEWWLPDVYAFATYTGYHVGGHEDVGVLPERDMRIGLRLSIDLESKGQRQNQISATRFDVLAIEFQKEDLGREIAHTIHEYRSEMSTQGKLIATFEDGIKKSEKLLRQRRAEFERGIADSDDITGTIRSIYDLRRKRIDSVAAYFLAHAGLETMAAYKKE